MRAWRSVTLQPIAMPSRSLKPAIDFLALVTSGFWPLMIAKLLDGLVERLCVLLGLAHAHVERDLREPRDLHRRS